MFSDSSNPDAKLLAALRQDLLAADYTEQRLLSLVSEAASRACLQGYTAAAAAELEKRVNTAESAAAVIALLFFAGAAVPEVRLEAAFANLGVQGLLSLGLVSDAEDGEFRAALSLTPVQLRAARPGETVDCWFISDLDDHLRLGAALPDHVMGIGGATRTLLKQLPSGMFKSANRDEHVPAAKSRPFPSALDLGTGCGVLAVQLAQFSNRVVATDISSRALRLAACNLRLNEIDNVELLQGSLFEPVSDQRFDLIASNPPFVISPNGADYEYRSSEFSGDELVKRLLQGVPAQLHPDGEFVSLLNWEVHWGQSRFERPSRWLESLPGVHSWLVAREVMAPLDYAMMWARDGGSSPHTSEFAMRVSAAQRDFQLRKTVAVVMGFVRIIATECTQRSRTVTVTGQMAAGAVGNELSRIHRCAVQLASLELQEFFNSNFVTRGNPQEHRRYRPGQADPNRLWLAVTTPFAQQFEVDPLVAAAVGASDGELSLGQIAAALADLFTVPIAECYAALHTEFLELVWAGVLATERQQ